MVRDKVTDKKKPKKLRTNGSISTSNVNGSNQCITLTYSIKNVGNLLQARKLVVELDDLHDEAETTAIAEITNFETDEEIIDIKYKVKSCEGEGTAHALKETLDKFLKKKGGQTTLD